LILLEIGNNLIFSHFKQTICAHIFTLHKFEAVQNSLFLEKNGLPAK
jgi:hypothetical protein